MVRKLIFLGVLLVSGATAAYLLLCDSGQGTVYASWYYSDGSTRWRPLDTDSLVREIRTEGMNNVMLQLDKDPYASPSDEELEGAWELYRESFESAQRNGWFELENALEAGFYVDETDPHHFPNERNLLDGQDLVPDKPEFLMYYEHPEKEDGKVLAGFMYVTSGFDTHGEQVGGSLTRWHKHMYSVPDCFGPGLVPSGWSIRELALREAQGWECDGVKSSESAEMIHVWFVDHPVVSQFAVDMTLGSDVIPIENPEMMSKGEFIEKHRPRDQR